MLNKRPPLLFCGSLSTLHKFIYRLVETKKRGWWSGKRDIEKVRKGDKRLDFWWFTDPQTDISKQTQFTEIAIETRFLKTCFSFLIRLDSMTRLFIPFSGCKPIEWHCCLRIIIFCIREIQILFSHCIYTVCSVSVVFAIRFVCYRIGMYRLHRVKNSNLITNVLFRNNKKKCFIENYKYIHSLYIRST